MVNNKPLSDNAKQKIRGKLSKRKLSQKHKENLRKSNSNFRHSKESKDKIAQTLSNKSKSPEHKANISEGVKRAYENMSLEERRSKVEKILQGQKSENTKPERLFEKMLIEKKIAYEKQKWIDKYRVDFFLPKFNTIIEIQGCYWHGCEECGYDSEEHLLKRKLDILRKERLEQLGYVVKFIWQHQLISQVVGD